MSSSLDPTPRPVDPATRVQRAEQAGQRPDDRSKRRGERRKPPLKHLRADEPPDDGAPHVDVLA